MYTKPTITKDLTDSIFRQLALDLSKRVTKLEEAAKVTERPKTPPVPIAQAGDILVNKLSLSDYTIISVEIIDDLVVYTADVNGRELRIGQDEMKREFVRRGSAPAPKRSRAADVTVQQLRRIADQLNDMAISTPANEKELRGLATEITANIIPHIQFIGVEE